MYLSQNTHPYSRFAVSDCLNNQNIYPFPTQYGSNIPIFNFILSVS